MTEQEALIASQELIADHCRCFCHGGYFMHVAPCCYLCPKCNGRISVTRWPRHETACRTIDELLEENPAVLGELPWRSIGEE